MSGKKAISYVLLCILFFGCSFSLLLYFGNTKTGLASEEEMPEAVTKAGDKEEGGASNAPDTLPAVSENSTEPVLDIRQTAEDFGQTLRKIRSEHKRIVVLDAGGGAGESIQGRIESASGEKTLEEKDLTLDLAKRCRKLLEEQDIYVVMSREDDSAVSADARVYLANAIPADLFISLHVFEDADTSVYGMKVSYNGEFYMQGYSNGQLAYSILENATESANEKALGVFEETDGDSALRLLMIPGVELDVGCLSNKQQARLLEREDYRDKVSQGICDGILEAFETMEKGNE